MKRLTDLTGLAALCCSLLYLWRPDTALLFMAANVLFIVAMVVSAVRATPSDRAHLRKTAWLIPVSTGLVALYVVAASSAEDRMRNAGLAAALLAAGGVLFWARRRAS
jgi:uncharacterized membrane protein